MDAAETSGWVRFGSELRAHRTAKGWTQVQLGKEIGYSGSFVSDVERGDRGVVEEFAKACDATFGTPGTFVRLWEDAQRSLFPVWFAPVIPIEREAEKISGDGRPTGPPDQGGRVARHRHTGLAVLRSGQRRD